MWENLDQSLMSEIKYILIIFGVLFSILGYLFRKSEYFGANKFWWSSGILSGLTLFSLLFVYFSQKTYPDKLRIAIFPVMIDSLSAEDTWLGSQLQMTIEKILRHQPQTDFWCYDFEQLQAVFQPDSLKSATYRQRFATRIRLDYYLQSQLISDSNTYIIKYTLNTAKNVTIFSEIIRFNKVDTIPHLGLIIAKTVLSQLPVTSVPNIVAVPILQPVTWQLYVTAREHYMASRLQLAQTVLKHAISADTTNGWAWLLYAESYLDQVSALPGSAPAANRWLDSARICLEPARSFEFTRVEAELEFARLCLLQKKWGLAEQTLRLAYSLDASNPKLWLYFSQLHPDRYQDLGFKNVDAVLKYALFLNPGYLPAALRLADHYTNSRQQPDLAIAILQELRTLNSRQTQVLMELGRRYMIQNRFEDVLAIFSQIINIEPQNSMAYYNLGVYYFNRDNTEEALKLFNRAIAIDQHLDAHLYRAYIYEKLSAAVQDRVQQGELRAQAIEDLRYRIRHRLGKDDPYAETARARLATFFK